MKNSWLTLLLLTSPLAAQEPLPAWDIFLPPPFRQTEKLPPLTNEEIMAKALREGIPLVIGVECLPAVPKGYLSYAGEFDGETRSVIVAVPLNGKFKRVDLPANASASQIRNAAEKARSGSQPNPFLQTSFKELSTGEAAKELAEARPVPSVEGGRRWPKGLIFPEGLAPYKHASNTQRIAVTNGVDTIQPVSRTQTLAKWQVPGGLEGIEGWHSDLYKRIGEDSYRWVADIAVFNGSNYQNNRGWKRAYGDGTLFADVLSKDGVVFEVRYREKNNGRWENHVAYRNKEARPNGYYGLKSTQCATCHKTALEDAPGAGGYAVGLIPGGDQVFSDPFPVLERGNP